MSAKPIETVDVRDREHWRTWLKEHSDSKSEIWLVFHKRHTGVASVPYDDAVEEALCYGWIDSLVRRLDDAPRPSVSALPPYIEEALKTVPRAWQYFNQLAPSYQRGYIGWIDSAKREETKERRLREALSLLASGKKLGLK